MMASFVPAKEDAEARLYIQQLHNKEFEKIEERFDAVARTPDMRATLEKMSALIPAGPPRSIRTVGAYTFKSNDSESVKLTYELEYPSTWLLIYAVIETKAGSRYLAGLHVMPEADSVENRNRFSLKGKSFLQYAFLVLAIVAALFTLVTLFVCIRTRPLKRKWLWIIGILTGFGVFGVNWTSGEVFFESTSFQFFSAAAYAAPFSPWIVSFSIPVFAFAFWDKRRRILREARAEAVQPGTD